MTRNCIFCGRCFDTKTGNGLASVSSYAIKHDTNNRKYKRMSSHMKNIVQMINQYDIVFCMDCAEKYDKWGSGNWDNTIKVISDLLEDPDILYSL